jgi:hypothetical protein
VDLEFSFDGYGAVYICDECVKEMARTYGMITTDQAIELKAEVETLQTALYEAEVTNQGLERAVSGLTTARRYSAPVPVDRDVRPSETSTGSEEGLSEPAEDLDGGTEGTPESVHDKGMDDVRSDGSGTEFRLGV